MNVDERSAVMMLFNAVSLFDFCNFTPFVIALASDVVDFLAVAGNSLDDFLLEDFTSRFFDNILVKVLKNDFFFC